ncbi:MAG: excinuclease ABC subunit UvrC [Bacillota bacterium]
MDLGEKLKLLPDKPGVYLMHDVKGQIIYVGKAASLKNRVRSYFHAAKNQSPKVRSLVERIVELEYIITDSEVEALILECNLIKKHRPKYNISLRDDKSYPYLKVTINEEFPRLIMVRSMLRDGARYFGPYTRAGAVHETVKLLRSLFPLRSCKQSQIERKSRPCLNAHIGRCLAPCNGRVDPGDYRELVQKVVLFLEGRHDDLVRLLESRMAEAAEKLDFERAAELRDQVRAVTEILAKQKITFSSQEDQDVLAFASEYGEVCGQVFFIRRGKLIGREHFFLQGTEEMASEEIMTAFVTQYYSGTEEVPGEILLQKNVEDREIIEEWLGRKRGKRVRLKTPQRGDKLQLVEMVHKNALMILEEREVTQRREQSKLEEALADIARYLELTRTPYRIECFDISNIQGRDAVGAMAVFENGKPKTSAYRRFKIKTVQGPDDYASLREVLRRRFQHAGEEVETEQREQDYARLPDLVIIDGGRGQLSAAREAMGRCGAEHIPTFGMAKGEELLFREGDPRPIVLPRESQGLFLLQRLRNEAHRFAVTYHRQLRDKRTSQSMLDEIPGIGPKRKKALLRQFGSVQRMKEVSVEELAAVEGMTKPLAVKVFDYLQS